MESLEAAIDELVATDPSFLADPQTIVHLHQQLARLEAVTARAAERFDRNAEWRADNAASGAAWLAWKLHAAKSTMHRRIAAGRFMRIGRRAAEAWLAGTLTLDHVSRLARSCTRRTARSFERDEEMLVGHAHKLSFDEFSRSMAYWDMHADPDGAESRAERQRQSRHAFFSETLSGMFKGDGLWDPVSGAIIDGELRRITQEMFEADRREAKDRLGRDPKADELGRTAAQRRADAFAEMAIRSASTAPDARRPEPLFTVLCDYPTYEKMLLELGNGRMVTPGSMLPWLDRSWIERVVFDGPSRVIDIGVRRRLFRGATRRAVLVRDRVCFHETCDEPSERCEVDHVLPYAAGGFTVQHNGRAACGIHNRSRNLVPDPLVADNGDEGPEPVGYSYDDDPPASAGADNGGDDRPEPVGYSYDDDGPDP